MDSLMQVREFLKNYNVEIVEFDGGEYNTDKLLSSDIVLILPHTLPKAFNYDFYLGKGQYTEYSLIKKLKNKRLYFVICLGDELYVSTFDDDDIVENDWKKEFVHVWCKDTLKPLHKFEPSIVKIEKEIITSIKNKNLLIVYKKLQLQ